MAWEQFKPRVVPHAAGQNISYVSLHKDYLRFSTAFMRKYNLLNCTAVLFWVDNDYHLLGFKFLNKMENKAGFLSGQKKGPRSIVAIGGLLSQYPWIKEIAQQNDIWMRRFPIQEQKDEVTECEFYVDLNKPL